MTGERSDLKKENIRRFFLTLENKARKTSSIEQVKEDLASKGLAYKQMKLPVSKISPEFEKELKEKVERNILHAKIREATEEDLESVMHLYNRSWMTSNTPFSPITLDSLQEIFSYSETVILIAKVYGSDAGFAILDFEDGNKYGIIAGMGVIPRFQRKGLGTVLGMAAWNLFKEAGVEELRCEVYVENENSHNFISSLGFEVFETRVYKTSDFGLHEEGLTS